MSGANTFKFVMLPPQTDVTREWGRKLGDTMPEVRVVIAEDQETAEREIVDAEAAFGWLPKELLAKAARLRWLQAPQAAPAAGYYYPELIAHSLTVTNFREIFNDHISAHIMAFVLAFARGFQHYFPRQVKREWRREPDDTGVIHLPDATALIVGVGGIGSEAARLAAAFGMHVTGVDARRVASAGSHRADRRRWRHRNGDRTIGCCLRHDRAGDGCTPHSAAARRDGAAQAGGAG